jgi:hypothetical protein
MLTISDISNPPTAGPIVVPTLVDDTNNPLAKSGASGSEDAISYSTDVLSPPAAISFPMPEPNTCD